MKSKLSLFIIYMSMFLAVGASVLYSHWVVQENNAKFCRIVTVVDDAFSQAPDPQTEVGRNMKEAYAQTRKDLGC